MSNSDALRSHIIAVTIGCWCCTATPVRAEPIDGGEVPAGLHADTTYTDVYVNDSFEAADAIARAQVLTRRKQWSEAAQALQHTSDTAADKLVRVAPGYYVGTREHINKMIAAWPKAGIAAYRSLFEREIQELLSSPTISRAASSLLPKFDRYFCTASAAKLADRIGQSAIESGDLTLADYVYRRVLEYHPDRDEYAPRYRAMLTVIAAMRGVGASHESPTQPAGKQPEKAEPQTGPLDRTKVRWMGEDITVLSVANEVREGFSALRAPTSPWEWPTFGGDVERNRRCSTDVEEPGLLWRFEAFGRRTGDSPEGRVEEFSGSRDDHTRYLSIHPVLSDGLLFAQRFRDIVALYPNTGAVAWRFSARDKGSVEPNYLDEQPPGWDSVTVHDGRVYASLPGDAVPYYSYESSRSPPELVCLDAATGSVIWRIDQQAIEEAFAEVSFDSAPIIHQGRFFVVGRRRRSFGFEDCYLYRFDAATGMLEHRTHLGSASTGTFGSRLPTGTIPAMHGDTLYVCSNLGSVAAVSVQTGAVRWLRMYDREQTDADRGLIRLTRNAKPWHFNSAIWSAGRVIVLPSDTATVLVLDSRDGKRLHSLPVENLGGLETILGVRGDILCGAGREVACYDLANHSLRWSTPLPDGEGLHGRGVWADDRLLVPTRKLLCSFSVEDGKQSSVNWSGDGEGGNLLALPDQLLVAGAGRLSAFVRKAEILSALRARMAASPLDPLPALELAEIALLGAEQSTAGKPGDNPFTEAVGVLDEAVRRTRALREPLEPAMARRLFDDILMFVDRLSAHSMLEADLLKKLFAYASQFPPDATAHVGYRCRFAALFEKQNQPERSVRLYQQILRDRSLRRLPFDLSINGVGSGTRSRSAQQQAAGFGMREDSQGLKPASHSAAESAGGHAQQRISELITKHGRSIYAKHEAEARSWLDSAKATGDETKLGRIVETFPNSEAAPDALVALGELLARRGDVENAAKSFARAYHRYPKRVDRPTLLRQIADTYEQAGKAAHAYRWLTKAVREHPAARIEHDGRSVSFSEYRERLAHVRRKVEPSRPSVDPPLDDGAARKFDGSISLLAPRFGDQPASRWSRYFVQTSAGIRAFDAQSGTEVWPQPAPVRRHPELLIALSDVAVFVTLYEVFAVDLETGARRWSQGQYPKDLDAEDRDWEDGEAFRDHSLQGNRLVSVRDNGQITCIAIDTGEVVWSKTHRPEPIGRVHLADPWVVYHVMQDDRVVVCLIRAATGVWSDAITTDENRPAEEIFITLDGQLVVVTSQSVSSYDPESRTRRWRVSMDGHIRQPSLLLDLDALYFSENGRRLRKISLEDGHLLWESQELVRRSDDHLTVKRQSGSMIFSTTSTISAVDTVTGLTLWQATAPERPHFVVRLVSRSYVIAVDAPGAQVEADGAAYFYDHRNASGLIARDGGAVKLGRLSDVRSILAVDGALLIQTGSTIHRWQHK